MHPGRQLVDEPLLFLIFASKGAFYRNLRLLATRKTCNACGTTFWLAWGFGNRRRVATRAADFRDCKRDTDLSSQTQALKDDCEKLEGLYNREGMAGVEGGME